VQIDIDGLSVLRGIVAEPDVFPDVQPEFSKIACSLVTKQLKVKAVSVESVRKIRNVIGEPSFSLIIDGMTESETKSLSGKLDKNHPELKTASANWHRRQIVALASGTVEPTSKPSKKVTKPKAEAAQPAKATQAAKPKTKRALSSKAAAATWDRGNKGG
jgi:hypothetical protein